MSDEPGERHTRYGEVEVYAGGKRSSFTGLVFFFQAEDGIRDHCVTGVQTCALPIWLRWARSTVTPSRSATTLRISMSRTPCGKSDFGERSEERRVGKECRSRWS